MAHSHWLVLISVIVLLVDLAAGIALGWWIHEINNVRANVFNARHAIDALRDLHDLTCDVAGRVGQHLTRVDAISHELATLRAGCSGPKDRAVVDAVSRIVEFNEELTQELADAKLKLGDQADMIAAQAKAAMADLLTGLPNRRGFDDELRRRIAQWQQQETPISVLMVDIDNLQKLQEVHGAQAADDVLRGVAGVLNETMRAMDLIARYGENQFAAGLPGTHLSEAKKTAEKLRSALAEREFHVGETPVKITVSEGVSEALPGDDMGTLLERTALALAASHEAGGNCAYLHDGDKCEAIPIEQPTGGLLFGQQELMALAKQLQAGPVDPHTDPLTGLLNRRSFFEGLRHRIAEHNLANMPLTLAVIDLDNMKNLNKVHGHLVGDVVLRTVTQIIRSATRAHLDIAARYHEDKLAVVLVHTELRDAVPVAERIRRAIAACKLKAEGTDVQVTVSIGVSELPRGADAVALLKSAEDAVRVAKAAGRNRTYLHDGTRAVPATSQTAREPAAV
ncbi:MAG TPA: GGDEF domain-containing protein [Pirellulales bacterium]|nr:GGDEF domain-containing protein [Pirellulales bacterium]